MISIAIEIHKDGERLMRTLMALPDGEELSEDALWAAYENMRLGLLSHRLLPPPIHCAPNSSDQVAAMGR